MELRDAVRRIVFGHLPVFVVLIAAGLTVATVLHHKDVPQYAAKARVVLDTPDPQVVTQATAVADAAQAIVTSPSHVSAALRRVAVSRSADSVAQHDVTLQSVGTSNVLQLTVRDRDPRVAAALANALADDLIKTRLQVDRGQLDARIQDVQSRIDDVDRQISQLPSGAQTPQLTSLQSQRSSLTQEKLGLTSQRDSRPNPMIVDPAAPPSQPEPSRLPLDLALGSLLGLVAALAVASMLEILRPTHRGPRAVARAVGLPVIGELDENPDYATTGECTPIAPRLRLAAAAANASTIVLVRAGPAVELETLALQLRRTVNTRRDAVISIHVGPPAGARPSATGVAIVAPTTLTQRDLDVLDELLSIAGWSPLGLITYRPRRRRLARRPGWLRRHGRQVGVPRARPAVEMVAAPGEPETELANERG